MINLKSTLKEKPVIAAIRTPKQFKEAIQSSAQIVFILYADIFSINTYVNEIRRVNKISFIHVDLLEGLGKDKKAIEYIARKIKPDGIITTRSNLIKYAKEKKLYTIQRFFIVDSQSLTTCIKTVNNVKPDMIEIMPGVIPYVIKELAKEINTPIIAGGLIKKQKDILLLLENGAIGVSTGMNSLWENI